jgi:transcriptional regulator with PAS, ATPase and Fis domain
MMNQAVAIQSLDVPPDAEPALPPDPVFDMGVMCAAMAHKALHGRTRSLITFTPAMFHMLDELQVAAAHDVTLLLIGETGSGKTFLARLIHELSPRSPERCVTVACGALPPDLIESELFGYVKGAFTGADRDKLGKFAAAGEGTLLLDEIDVLPPEQQAKLLRVIETGEYEPVGSNETQTSKARLVVASNFDLEDLVRKGTFRTDLYYRLNVLNFHLLPLRQRPLDIEFLTRDFALRHGRTHGIQIHRIESECIEALKRFPWPGNIRELENVIRRAVLYSRQGILSLSDLPSALRSAAAGNDPDHPLEPIAVSLEARVDVAERKIIEESLARHHQRRNAAAKELGISRVTLYNKMKKFGMIG